MARQDQEQVEAEVEQTPSDPWAMAFAALGEEDAHTSEEASDTGEEGGPGDLGNSEESDGEDSAATPEGNDSDGAEDLPGGPGDLGGDDSGANENSDSFDIGVTQEEIDSYRKSFEEDIRNRAIRDVAQAYINHGARHNNGVLGASINDPDVCKRDRDGVPRFYNPETGREFTGDNPRRQAQEWVDDYNRELAEQFNKTCEGYEKKLLQEEGGRLAIMEFAPKYAQLDPVRRSMFDSIIEDYEIKDNNGDVVAYSCDLDKALAAVNRQVRVIQQRFANQQTKPADAKKPTGPALDTPNTGGGKQSNGRPQFKSIEEAMEWEQDQILAKMKGNAR